MRSARLFAVAVLSVLVLAMPASAHVNLLQNPGFETGDFLPWEIDGGGNWNYGLESPGHTGTYYAWIASGEGGGGSVWQYVDPPLCAEYLEFYYRGEEGEGGHRVDIEYSDGTDQGEELPTAFLGALSTSTWTLRS